MAEQGDRADLPEIDAHKSEEQLQQWQEFLKGVGDFGKLPAEIRMMIYRLMMPRNATIKLQNNLELVCLRNQPYGANLAFASKAIMYDFLNLAQWDKKTEIYVQYLGPPEYNTDKRKTPKVISKQHNIKQMRAVEVVITVSLHDKNSTAESLSDPKMRIPEPNEELWTALISNIHEFIIRVNQPDPITNKDHFNDKTLSPEEMTNAWINAARPYLELFGKLFKDSSKHNKDLVIKVDCSPYRIEAQRLVEECFPEGYQVINLID